LSVAISRELGARGGTIARLVAEKLAWQLYDHDLLEYMAQNPVIRQGTGEELTVPCQQWIRTRLDQLDQTCRLAEYPDARHLAEVVLSLAASGQVVMVGRGAGCILPRETTLNVRIIAPLADRIAFIGQWQRLSTGEASERVRQGDERRAEFVQKHFRRTIGDTHQYDLVLNSSLLGEDGCADLIARAAWIRWGLVTDLAS
jgi:cytidylate kinase